MWFIGIDSCYAAEVLADNETFLLAVNRMVAFSAQDCKPTTHIQLSSSTVALLVDHLPLNHDVVGSSPTWACAARAELSYPALG